MRSLVAAICLGIVSLTPAAAQDAATSTPPVKGISEAERARIKKQVSDLQQSKIQQGQKAAQAAGNAAANKTDSLNQELKNQQQTIDRVVGGQPWLAGPALARKKALEDAAAQEKAKVAADASRRVDAQVKAAKQSADNVNQSIQGLKSQVTPKGQYGLKPKGSSLYVRQYGK